MARDQIDLGLRRLQRLVGEDAGGKEVAQHYRLPDDLVTEEANGVTLNKAQNDQRLLMKQRLLADPRFEHLGDGAVPAIDKTLWRFVCEVALQPDSSHVEAFMTSYGREALPHIIYFPVEALEVTEAHAVGGARLLPPGHEDLPNNPWIPLGEIGGSVLSVEASGTSARRMYERARPIAEHALAILRVGFRTNRQVPDDQLRFRLSAAYGVDEALGGWQRDQSVPILVTLNAQDMKEVLSQPLASLPATPQTDVERKAVLALKWLGQARLTPDTLLATLFDFFALEAILGTKDEEKKGALLALRAAVLASLDEGHFQHPSEVFSLYADVRSAAVHGEEPPTISARDFYWFDRTVRESLNRALTFCRDNNIDKRTDLITALDRHPEMGKLVSWLREQGPGWESEFGEMGPGT